ncbi:hypothetical protein H0H92_009864 [Tricholoma furcatifolium]|nr:hypothetical protein H0H92_009864 [Tricholoma furcatifolium]
MSLDSILANTNLATLNSTLRASTLLAGTLSNGQDPLATLDPRENTLGVLYILSARFSTPTSTPPPWTAVEQFCQNFIPDHARLAPDRVTSLARGISSACPTPKAAIAPLLDLISRYPYDASYLTTIHATLALACVRTYSYSALLPILATPITNIDLTLSPDLTYSDSLTYHYLGGIAFAALKRWRSACEFFEIALSAPGAVPAALQLEALKKLRLVQLIAYGKIAPLPKYTHTNLPRLFKNTPYSTFVNNYPHNIDTLRDLVHREEPTFSLEKNLGLINQALARAPRWTLKKLTGTYITLSLSDIAKAINLPSEDAVRALLLDMIESSDITAHISTDSVTFSDPTPAVSQSQIDTVLREVQAQSEMLRTLERDMSKNKDYLAKAVKNRDDSSAWSLQVDEEVFAGIGGPSGPVWAEDASGFA